MERDDVFAEKVEHLLASILVGEYQLCDPEQRVLVSAAKHLLLAPGAKRIRPQLCWRFAQLAGLSPDRVVDLAVAVELIHTASLLHDDVIDDGMLRRDRPSANARWGNTVSILTGDLLVSRGLLSLANYPQPITARALVAIAELSRGLVLESQSRGKVIRLDAARRIAEEKTGALFGLCGSAIEILANRGDCNGRFESAGRHLGTAFQIADDLWDFWGGAQKEAFADVRGRVPSYLLMAAAASSEEVEKMLVDQAAVDEMQLRKAIVASGAIDRSLRDLAAEIRQAESILRVFADHPSAVEIVGWGKNLVSQMQQRSVT